MSSDTLIISKIHKVSAHGTTLYVTIPRSCYSVASSTPLLYAYIAGNSIVYSVEPPVAVSEGAVLVAGNRIVLLPAAVKSVVYRVRVAKVNSNALAVRIPALFARILRIAKSSNVNVICYDSKIVVKPL
jgi:hypothetical protein